MSHYKAQENGSLPLSLKDPSKAHLNINETIIEADSIDYE